MERPRRRLISWIVGVGAFPVSFLFLFPAGCNVPDGVPSWERCQSFMGLSVFSVDDWGIPVSLNVLIPLVVSALAGFAAWWAIGFRDRPRR